MFDKLIEKIEAEKLKDHIVVKREVLYDKGLNKAIEIIKIRINKIRNY